MKHIKIITKDQYDFLLYQIRILREERNELKKELLEVKKQLLYQKTYNTVFRQKLDEVIYPNTDERGLGDSRPMNSEEEPDYSDF